MDCLQGIIFLLISLLTARAQNLSSSECYWAGGTPFCTGECRPGEVLSGEPHNTDSNGCLFGTRKYCCKTISTGSDVDHELSTTQRVLVTENIVETTTTITTGDCYWAGQSPICDESCGLGEYVADTSRTGNGSMCIIGRKNLCCKDSSAQATEMNTSPTPIISLVETSSVPSQATETSTTVPSSSSVATVPTTTPTSMLTSSTENTSSRDCYWVGTSPICDGSCNTGDIITKMSRTGNGSLCIIGIKRYCCKIITDTETTTSVQVDTTTAEAVTQTNPTSVTTSTVKVEPGNCYWVGRSPICEGACSVGDVLVNTSRSGDGSTCIIGRKKYCCRGSSLQRTFDDGVDTALAINSSSESTTMASLTTPTKTIGKCYWAGTGPDCEASCRSGEFMAATSIEVQGQRCETGRKALCCSRFSAPSTLSSASMIAEPSGVMATNGEAQTTNSVQIDSIPNVTSRPFQPLFNGTGHRRCRNGTLCLLRRRTTTQPLTTLPPSSTNTTAPRLLPILPELTTASPSATTESTTVQTITTAPKIAVAVDTSTPLVETTTATTTTAQMMTGTEKIAAAATTTDPTTTTPASLSTSLSPLTSDPLNLLPAIMPMPIWMRRPLVVVNRDNTVSPSLPLSSVTLQTVVVNNKPSSPMPNK